jgi:hypothetical protein
VKVGTPLGTYPFEFRRIERREGGIAVVGLVAGLESSVVVEPAHLRSAVKFLAPPLAVLGLFAYRRRAHR